LLWDLDKNLLVFDEVTVGKFYASELIQEQYRKYHRRKQKHMAQTPSDMAENDFQLQVKSIIYSLLKDILNCGFAWHMLG